MFLFYQIQSVVDFVRRLHKVASLLTQHSPGGPHFLLLGGFMLEISIYLKREYQGVPGVGQSAGLFKPRAKFVTGFEF